MHTANQPYNVLDGADKQSNGRKPEDLANLNRYAPVLRSYCAAGDPVCAGGNVVADHLNYFELYTDDASSWVVSKIDSVAPLPSCGVVSSSSVPASSTAPVSSSAAIQSSAIAPTSSPVVTSSATPTKVESSAAETPCSTSPAMVSPFPKPVPYKPDACILEVHVEYAYV
jgi:hypothetical protein